MREVYIIEAARTAIGRRGGALSTVHPADLLGQIQKGAVERAGIEPGEIGQIVGGCVSQVGEQSFNIARNAWLARRRARALALQGARYRDLPKAQWGPASVLLG